MNSCPNLYILSAIACTMADNLTDEELEVLSADLTTLADMLASILAHESLCGAKGKKIPVFPISSSEAE